MSDLPTRDDLIEAGAKAHFRLEFGYVDDRDWDRWPHLHAEYIRQSTAILDAVLPLALKGVDESFDQALRQWKMYAEMHDDEGDRDIASSTTAEGDLYRRARTVSAHLKGMIKETERG